MNHWVTYGVSSDMGTPNVGLLKMLAKENETMVTINQTNENYSACNETWKKKSDHFQQSLQHCK